MVEIPISSLAPHFSQEHYLFGHSYLFEFEWIEREKLWTLHLYDGLERPIALGLQLTTGWPVLLDTNRKLLLLLLAKKPDATLSFSSLQIDFMLVARELV